MFAPVAAWQAATSGVPTQDYWLNLVAASSQKTSITDAAQNGALDVSGDLSIKFRFVPSSNGITERLVSKSGATNNFSYRVYRLFNNNFYFAICADGIEANRFEKRTSSAPSLTVGVEYDLAFVFDNTAGTMAIYVDGSPVATTVASAGAATSGIFDGTSDFEIGAVGTGNYADCQIADVQVWSKALSSTEVSNLVGTDVDPATANLVGLWYKSNNHNDETSNGNDLTPTNSPTFSAYP